MTMPGFTAGASLYEAGGHYRGGARAASASLNPSARAVHPAAAIYVGGRFVCNGEVTSNGFINCYQIGGGGGGGCRPGCSPCRNVPGVGRRKTCWTVNCDDREVRC